MSASELLASKITTFNNRIGKIVSWFALLMAMLTLLIVVLRYGFGLGWIALQESAQYLHACIFMLGAAFTLNANEHVRVDIFYRNFSPVKQAWVNLLGSLLLLLPVALFVLFMSWEYVLKSWQLLESSQAAGGLPFLYLFKTLIVLFSVLLSVQAIAEILKNLAIVRSRDK